MKKVKELRQILSFESTLKEGFREGKPTCQTRSNTMLRKLKVGLWSVLGNISQFSVVG